MLTLADVIGMPVVKSADPLVLAGGSSLDRGVRWVHTTELADIGPLLRDGDLVLTTGIALPEGSSGLAEFARSLAVSKVAGLFVELGRRWAVVPESLVDECEILALPLVVLRREVRFAAVAQAVGERLVDEQLVALREAERIHDTFTELSIAEAGPEEILAAVERLSGSAVVLESEQHQILDFRSGPDNMQQFLADWARRSRNVHMAGRTTWDQSNGWLVTRLGRTERAWGRLIVGSEAQPSERSIVLIERAAAALATDRLHQRSRDARARRLHQELILGLLGDPNDKAIHRRVQLTGFGNDGCQYVGLAMRMQVSRDAAGPERTASLDELVASALHSAAVQKVKVLIGAFESDVRVLLVAPAGSNAIDSASRFGDHLRSRTPHLAAVGTPASDLQGAGRSMREALHVLDALPEDASPLRLHQLDDLRLRGLLSLLAEDDRVTAFAERELGPLRGGRKDDLLVVLQVVLECGGSKSEAAGRLGMSRPALYDRIRRIERLLGVDLADPESRTSLHVAVMFSEAPRNRPFSL